MSFGRTGSQLPANTGAPDAAQGASPPGTSELLAFGDGSTSQRRLLTGSAANLLAAMRRLPHADAFGDLETELLKCTSRGIGAVRGLVACGIPIDVVQRATWIHRGFEFVQVSAETVASELLNRLPLAVCRSHVVIPHAAPPHGSAIAMSNPDDLDALDALRSHLGRSDFRIVIADRHAILNSITTLETRDAARTVELAADAAAADASRSAEEAEGDLAQLVRGLIEHAVRSRASDIHFEPGAGGLNVRERVDGVLRSVASHPSSMSTGIVNRLKVMADLDLAERRLPQEGRVDFAMASNRVGLRVVTIPTVSGDEGAVIRILQGSKQMMRAAELGMSSWTLEALRQLGAMSRGLVLAAGPTGAGKTTTLYAALAEMSTPETKIITVEEPVEIHLPTATQVQINRKAGITFGSALRSFLRADPDILLVGEIRDRETAGVCIEAALTGRLVLASTHANDAAAAVVRMAEFGIRPRLIAAALRGVVAQRLVRRLCEGCRLPERAGFEHFEHLTGADDLPTRVWRASPVGCDICSGTGYFGRVPIAEVMQVGETVAAAIAEETSPLALGHAAVKAGMIPMRDDGLHKVMRGETSLSEVLRA